MNATTVFKFVALLTVIAGCAKAGAQQRKYCPAKDLVANSSYSTVASTGSTSVVSYYLQLQNVNASKTITASPIRPGKIANFTILQSLGQPVELKRYQQNSVYTSSKSR